VSEQRLYRLWDSSDKLLYVGISKSAMQRIEQHLQSQPWAKDIARMTIELHPDRRSAEKAERIAIATENPIHNKRRYEMPDIPLDDLWPALSVTERRMVGSTLLVLAHKMHDDELDRFARSLDENYLSVKNALALVGGWLMRDSEPDQMLTDIFSFTERARQTHLNNGYQKMLDEKKIHKRTEMELLEDIGELEQENADLKSQIKLLRRQSKTQVRVIA
jgi:predicted GIY-YIG superfamily endonuclease